MNVFKALGKPFTALAGKVDHSLEQKILMSVLRHGATALGVALIAKGVLKPGAESAFTNDVIELVGLFLGAAGVTSGAAQKVRADAY